ncbi:MFS transporter [Paucibacter sp. APW11]|uniref:MFS transporter n=1 Tax=Roseateles aquae TaxID=3077235 RepID=A0ABU3P5R0_9BURK|nr:MFS transporter [Paucibacter sp. APW11]MDT8997907.1 MFS transporter [Paucibacter sp. APW11]
MIKKMRARATALGRPMQGLMASEVATVLALMVGYVAVPWWVAQHGGGQDLALNGVVVAIASFLLMPLLSPLGDRWPKQRLMMASLMVLSLGACGYALMIQLDAYRLALVMALGVLGAAASGVLMPATMSIAAELVPAAQLPEALSLQRSAQSLGRVLGPALGGALVSLGTGVALWAQCGLLLGAAWAVRSIPAASGHADGPARGPWRRELAQGLRAAWAVPVERGWTLVGLIGTVFLLPGFSMLVPLKLQSLGLSSGWLGAAETGLALGMLSGALGGNLWVAKWLGRFQTRFLSTVIQGLGLALAGWTAQGVVIVLALFVVGFANSCGVLVGQTHRMLAIPAHFRSRLNAVSMMSLQIASALGPALAGIGLARASVDAVYIGLGLAGSVSALGLLLVPGLREMLALDHEEVKEWYAKQHPHLFA